MFRKGLDESSTGWQQEGPRQKPLSIFMKNVSIQAIQRANTVRKTPIKVTHLGTKTTCKVFTLATLKEMGTGSYLAACTSRKLKRSKDPSVTPSGKSRAGIQTLTAFKHTETIWEDLRAEQLQHRGVKEQGEASGAEPGSSGPGPAELTRGESQLQGCEDEAFPLPEPDKITLYGQASPPARAGNLWLHSHAEQGRARLYLMAPSRGAGWQRLSPVTRWTARTFP